MQQSGNAPASAIKKDEANGVSSKHSPFEMQTRRSNDGKLTISLDKIRTSQNPSTIKLDLKDTEPTYRQEADVDLRNPRIMSTTNKQAHTRNASGRSLGGRGRYHDMTLE